MPGMSDLATALALVLVIEGCLWALFPDGMRRAAASIGEIPARTLRAGGLACAAAGVGAVWLIRG
jgi:uncharacterized protein YjeT (DUF2065 family)